jgi:hypothetical protein
MLSLGTTLAVLGTAVFTLVLAELAFARTAARAGRPVRTLDPLLDGED